MSTINVTVRCLAYGGKFIGSGMGFAQVLITDTASGTRLAAGTANVVPPNISGDGSGIVRDIMNQPYLWGTPVNPETAAAFHTAIPVDKPKQVTVSAAVVSTLGATLGSVSFVRWVFPGVDMTGKKAFQAVIEGLAASLPATQPLRHGLPQTITANVTMMCGCKIENVIWPGDDFEVWATINPGAPAAQVVPMTYAVPSATTPPSTFTGTWTPPMAGSYPVSICAIQRSNGNTAFATGTITAV